MWVAESKGQKHNHEIYCRCGSPESIGQGPLDFALSCCLMSDSSYHAATHIDTVGPTALTTWSSQKMQPRDFTGGPVVKTPCS